MTWWLWLIFWIAFTLCALSYLAWRCWNVWPHARDFGHTVSTAVDRINTARAEAEASTSSREVARRETDLDDLAWNKPAAQWRRERAQAKMKQREKRLASHVSVWSSWRKPLD